MNVTPTDEELAAAMEAEMERELEAASARDEAEAAVAAFGPLGGTATGPAAEAPLDALMDLTLPVSIELGRTKMTVQEILRLGKGSIVELDRVAGEPIDVHVGDRLFAQGEVVVVGEHFGIRITRVMAEPSLSSATA